jgi:hypothetical protein
MSSVAEAEAAEVLWNVRAQRRQASPDLPETVTRLTASDGSLLYLVGTAHFSDSSKQDVSMVGMPKTLNQKHGPYLSGYSCTGFVAACFLFFCGRTSLL